MTTCPAETALPVVTRTFAMRPGAGALSDAAWPVRALTDPMAPSVSVNGWRTTVTLCAATDGFSVAAVSAADLQPPRVAAATRIPNSNRGKRRRWIIVVGLATVIVRKGGAPRRQSRQRQDRRHTGPALHGQYAALRGRSAAPLRLRGTPSATSRRPDSLPRP